MEPPIIRLARILFQGNETDLQAFREAIDQPTDFIARHGRDLGYVRTPPGWVPDAWNLMLHFARSRGWVWEVDWREASDEIVAAVRSLRSAQGLPVDWDGVASENRSVSTREFLGILASHLHPLGETLVSLDQGSDSYPLALLPQAEVEKARRLAVDVGLGRVDVLGA